MTKVNSYSRTRGGAVAVCEPGWCGLLPKTTDLSLPVQVPLRSGIAACACASAAPLNKARAKARYFIVAPSFLTLRRFQFFRSIGCRRRRARELGELGAQGRRHVHLHRAHRIPDL